MAFPWTYYHERNALVSIKFGLRRSKTYVILIARQSYFVLPFLFHHLPPYKPHATLPPPNLAIDHQVSTELMYASIIGIQPVSLRCVSGQAGGCQLTVIKASYLLRRKR